MAKQIIFIEQQSLKNAVSVMNLKAGVYSCSCGHHDKAEVYYKPKRFYCPKCGIRIYKTVKTQNYTHAYPSFTMYSTTPLTEQQIRLNRFDLSYPRLVLSYIENSYDEKNKTIMIEAVFYKICFDPENYDTYFKTYTSTLKYYLEKKDIECLLNTKDIDKSKIVKRNKVNILDEINANIFKLKLPENVLATYFKDNDNIAIKNKNLDETLGFKFLKKVNLVDTLLNHKHNKYGFTEYINVHNLNLNGTNLKDITKLPKSICKELLDRNKMHPFFKDSRCDIWGFYKEYFLEQKTDINIIRNIQDICVRIRENEKTIKKLADSYVTFNCFSNFKTILYLYRDCHYSLNGILNYLMDMQYKQGIYTDEALMLLKDYNKLYRILKIEKYKKYPKHLKVSYDIISMHYSLIKMELCDKTTKEILEKNQFLEDHTDNEYEILLPKNAQEIIDECNRMGSHVEIYINQVVLNDMLMLFMRNKNEPQKDSIIELKENRIIEHKAKLDEMPDPKQREYIKKWAKKHDFKICC